MNRIMEFVSKLVDIIDSPWDCEAFRTQAKAALTTEVQSHIDYTAAVVRERDELKLAYAECSRQKNELLTKHKQSAGLRKAAQDVLDRWDTPLWKDVPATADYINALRKELGHD